MQQEDQNMLRHTAAILHHNHRAQPRNMVLVHSIKVMQKSSVIYSEMEQPQLLIWQVNLKQGAALKIAN
jgi:hypothetical protein